jgi:Tfp pilus assembly protein PilX
MEGKKQNANSHSRHTPYAIRHTSSRGFTLLLAALVSSITLAIGVSIFEITQKQIILSSLGRDSQFAFYTADTGAECALYFDVRGDIHPNTFATSTFSQPAQSVLCNQTTAAVTVTSATSDSAVSAFQFEPGGLCAIVTVTKQSSNPKTRIHADGYSTNCASIATNPRALQRSVEIKY